MREQVVMSCGSFEQKRRRLSEAGELTMREFFWTTTGSLCVLPFHSKQQVAHTESLKTKTKR